MKLARMPALELISQFNIAYPLTHPGAGTIETTRSRTGPGTVYAIAPGSEETIETAAMDAGNDHGSTDGSSTLKSFKREVGPYNNIPPAHPTIIFARGSTESVSIAGPAPFRIVGPAL